MKFPVPVVEIQKLFSNFEYTVTVKLPFPKFFFISGYMKITIYKFLKYIKRFMYKNFQFH